jgi:uncharacterized C2H2 Zn-finger protein
MFEGRGSVLKRNENVFLTLGDGDFSFSADLVAFCRQLEPRQATTIYATGFDSKAELDTKYKNTRFLLNQLQSDGFLNVEVHHGVNAVQPHSSLLSATHVIFNHPHLATEDAQRHSRFLAHFFHSSTSSWMVPQGGLVHLTLAHGQCERWKCLEMAERQGLVLVERNAFAPPPIKDPKYQHRRHQTGKSFSRRTTGSETLSFARRLDLSSIRTTCLPWQHLTSNKKQVVGISCPDCDRVFSEDRALKSHIQAVHGGSKKRQREDLLQCLHCTHRTFPREEALQDHIRAKHSVHTKILPEWAAEARQTGVMTHKGENFGECDICGHVYQSPSDGQSHAKEFIPEIGPCVQDDDKHLCTLCSKSFVDQRAKLQHENFCSSKKGEVPQRLKYPRKIMKLEPPLNL